MNLAPASDPLSLRRRLRAVADVLEIAPASVVALLLLASCAGAGLLALWWSARPTPAPSVPPAGLAVSAPSEVPSAAGDKVVVHVSGAVATPGIRELGGGARVDDAITAAGGADKDALLDQLNLARPLRDGEQIHVPTAEDGAADPADGSDGSGLVNLNRASVGELEELPGVGPVLATRIVAHREANGGFRSVDELRQVSGIGDKTFAELQDLVSV